jgi:hypothetical protein
MCCRRPNSTPKVEWLVAASSMSFDESIAYTESQIALLPMTEDRKEASRRSAKSASPLNPAYSWLQALY